MTGASASCFGERYWDILLQNLDENNSSTQTSTDRCTVVCKPFSYSIGVCVFYILVQFAGYMRNQTLYYLSQNETTSAVSPTGEKPTKDI